MIQRLRGIVVGGGEGVAGVAEQTGEFGAFYGGAFEEAGEFLLGEGRGCFGGEGQ